jgi:hypothetical protein
MGKNNDEKFKFTILNLAQIHRLKKKKYWCVLIDGRVLSQDQMPILVHKRISKEESMGDILAEARYKEKQITYKRADKALAILESNEIYFSNVIVEGGIEYEVFK